MVFGLIFASLLTATISDFVLGNYNFHRGLKVWVLVSNFLSLRFSLEMFFLAFYIQLLLSSLLVKKNDSHKWPCSHKRGSEYRGSIPSMCQTTDDDFIQVNRKSFTQ